MKTRITSFKKAKHIKSKWQTNGHKMQSELEKMESYPKKVLYRVDIPVTGYCFFIWKYLHLT